MRRGIAPDHHSGGRDHAGPCTPEYERTLAKGRRRHMRLLTAEEFFRSGHGGGDDPPAHPTCGARLEREAVAPPTSSAEEASSIALSIDGGHVKAVSSYLARSFEVLLAQVSNDNGQQTVFSSMPAEADIGNAAVARRAA